MTARSLEKDARREIVRVLDAMRRVVPGLRIAQACKAC